MTGSNGEVSYYFENPAEGELGELIAVVTRADTPEGGTETTVTIPAGKNELGQPTYTATTIIMNTAGDETARTTISNAAAPTPPQPTRTESQESTASSQPTIEDSSADEPSAEEDTSIHSEIFEPADNAPPISPS